MRRHLRDYSSSNMYALIVIFDILSRIVFVWAFFVVVYWLFTQFLAGMGINIPDFIKVICETPYRLAYMVGYTHHSGFNFAGGIAALIMFFIGYIFELICSMLIRR